MKENNEMLTPTSSPAEEIFFFSLEYETADERQAFVDRACQGDTRLRQRVDRLYESLADADDIFEKNMPEITVRELVEVLSKLP